MGGAIGVAAISILFFGMLSARAAPVARHEIPALRGLTADALGQMFLDAMRWNVVVEGALYLVVFLITFALPRGNRQPPNDAAAS